MTPLISVLISTFNRKNLVKNAIDSVLKQTFTDYELFIIDDQSQDGTREEILRCYPNANIKYIYNENNQGAEHGDKIHIKRFVHELATAPYWIYLDSDDYWIPDNLLERQIALFKEHPTAAMVTGGQESHFIPDNNKVFNKGVFPPVLNSDEFLEHFSAKPIDCNIIVGARLYNREMFIKSGALTGNDGRWESGFELNLAPGCYGGHIYIDEPCILTEIRPTNASFAETQYQHFMDSVASTKAGFRQPLIDFPNRGLDLVQRRVIENIAKAYRWNADRVRNGGKLSYCSEVNTSRLVEQEDVDKVLAEL